MSSCYIDYRAGKYLFLCSCLCLCISVFFCFALVCCRCLLPDQSCRHASYRRRRLSPRWIALLLRRRREAAASLYSFHRRREEGRPLRRPWCIHSHLQVPLSLSLSCLSSSFFISFSAINLVGRDQ